jgi:hypothetical protein
MKLDPTLPKELAGEYPGWDQGVRLFRFIERVVGMAHDISVVTMCRRLLEQQPELFSFCMNANMFHLLQEEAEEAWGTYRVLWPLRTEPPPDKLFFMGHPITIVDELPDGIIIGGL